MITTIENAADANKDRREYPACKESRGFREFQDRKELPGIKGLKVYKGFRVLQGRIAILDHQDKIAVARLGQMFTQQPLKQLIHSAALVTL
jgi:hypothetical protein